MAGSNIFKSIKSADSELRETGYFKAWLNILDDFTTLQDPDALTEDSVTGDGKIISAAHVWAAGKGPMSVYIDNKSLEAPGESSGDPASLKLKWTLKFFIKGDSPTIQDWVESILNQDIIAFVSDECPQAEVLQFGCDCLQGQVSKGTFSSGTLPSGSKGYNLEIEFYCRYFYRGGAIVAR